MELANRDHHEGQLATALMIESERQHKFYLQAMGWPADVSAIAEEHWEKGRRGIKRAVWGALGLIFTLSAAGLYESILNSLPRVKRTNVVPGPVTTSVPDTAWRVDPQEIVDAAYRWADYRSDELASGWIEHTQKKLREIATKAEADHWEKPLFHEAIEPIFGESRVESAAITETTNGQTDGGGFAKDKFEEDNPGDTILLVWRHRGAIRRFNRKTGEGHPCPACAPLIGLSQNEWQSVSPLAAKGPPLHPRCDCTAEEFLITAREAKRLKLEAPRNWSEKYEDQWQRIRTSRSNLDE